MKKLILIGIWMILLIGLVSAAEFDNVKKFSPDEKIKGKIEVINAFGLGSKLAEYKIDYHDDRCLFDCFTLGTATIYNNQPLFSKIDVKNHNNALISRKTEIFIEKIKTEERKHYLESVSCGTLPNGSNSNDCTITRTNDYNYTYTEPYWELYVGQNLNGTIRWKLHLEKGAMESTDWIPSAQGKEFTEWVFSSAGWTKYKNITVINNEAFTLTDWMIGGKINNISKEVIVTGFTTTPKADCSDIRWVNQSAEEVPWVNMSTCNIASGGQIAFRVRVGNIPSGGTNITIWYGNAGAALNALTNNKTLTYHVYDGFEQYANATNICAGTNWTCIDSTGSEVTDAAPGMVGSRALLLEGNSNFGGLVRGGQYDNVSIESQVFEIQTNNHALFLMRSLGSDNGYCNNMNTGGWNMRSTACLGGSAFGAGFPPSTNTSLTINATASINLSVLGLCDDSTCVSRRDNSTLFMVGAMGYVTDAATERKVVDEFTVYKITSAMPTYTIGAETDVQTLAVTSFNSTPISTAIFYNTNATAICVGNFTPSGTFNMNISLFNSTGALSNLESTTFLITNNGTRNVTHLFTAFGNYTWNCLVNDSSLTNAINFTINILNMPPIFLARGINETSPILYNRSFYAFANVSDQEGGIANLTITYYAPNGTGVYNASFTNGNTTVNAFGNNWSLDDGNQSTGTWNISFYVTDNGGIRNTSSITFLVNNEGPSNPVMLSPPSNVTIVTSNYTIVCGNSTDTTGNLIYYEIYADNAQPPTTLVSNATGNVSNYSSYNITGINVSQAFYVRCRAGDGQGGLSNYTASRSITRANVFSGAACTGTNSTQALVANITFRNENNDSKIWNADNEATLFYWSSDRNMNNTLLIDEPVTNETHICISPPDVTIYSDAKFQYFASGYDPREFYFTNRTLSNITENLTYYSLDITLASQIIFQIVDVNDLALSNLYMQILKEDIGTNTYPIVAMIKTDFNGEDDTFLRKADVFYRFIVYSYTDQGITTLFVSNSTKITADTLTIRITSSTEGELYNQFRGITTTFARASNSTTNTITATFSDPTGETEQCNLQALRFSNGTTTLLGNSTLAASSGSIVINLANSTGSYYLPLTCYLDNKFQIIDSYSFEVRGGTGTLAVQLGGTGPVLVFFLLLALALVGSFSVPIAIIFTLIGAVAASIMGMWQITGVYIGGIIFIGIIALIRSK